MNLLTEVIKDADKVMGLKEGAIIAVVAIIGVFAILLIIIGLTTLIFKATGLFALKKELDDAKKAEKQENVVPSTQNKSVEIIDDDMMAAVLVATIDYQQEIKQDVRVTNVREIK